jgi:putative ABC transport system permease protein
MGNLLQDVKYGLRMLAKNPGFTAVAVLTLALGIGANTTIFSVINATLLRSLAFPEPDRLVLVWETFGKGPDNINIVSAPNIWDFKQHAKSFEGMAIFDSAGRGYNLSPTGSKQEPEQVSGLRVSADFFPTLGVKPLFGRTFLPEEETLGRDREVVLSYGLWKRRYSGDSALVGKTIKIDGEDFTVVGVMPREFQWQFWSGPRQLWVPVGYTKTDFGRDDNSFICIARLKPGVSIAQAKAEMETIASGVRQQYPKEDANMGATVTPLGEFEMDGLKTTMLALLAAVGFVLLIACVNVANLMLARGAGRQKEFAIRRALGAAGSRIAVQMLTESLLLGLIGGAAGLLLAIWSNQLLLRIFQLDKLHLPLRVVDSLNVDGRVFAFALLVSCLTSVLFGLAPAISALRGAVNDPLKEGGRGSTQGGGMRLRNALVASEVALALVVLCGAGLMIESMARLLAVDPGLKAKNVLTMHMSVPQDEIYVGPPGLPRFCQDLDEHVSAIPGVISVGAIAHLPFEGNAGRGFQIEGQPPAKPGEMPGANYSVACPNYFRTMGIPILRGREFTHQDTLNSQGVIVINETMARKFWPKDDPIGKAIRLGGPDGPRLTIVGVFGGVHHVGLDVPIQRQFLRPYTQAGWPVMTVVVRTTSAPGTFTSPIKKALAEFLPDRPVSNVETMEEVVHDSTGSRRFPMLLLAGFAFLALALAAVGIAGVVSYSVAQRTQEIGIRMALGAGPRDVLALVLRNGMTWVLAGVALGVIGSLGLTRLLASLLFEVKPTDPFVLACVAVLLSFIAALANYIPARRATKVDPMVALRYE